MTKTYKLLIDSPEYPKGTLAVYKDEYLSKSYYAVGTYLIFYPEDHEQKLKRGIVYKEAVENRPHIWELQEDKLDLRSPYAEKMREESRATRFDFVPTVGSLVFCYDHAKNKPCRITYTQSFCNDWNNGFLKRTEEDCQAHGEKYARYFLTE